MPRISSIKTNFTAGEVSPRLLARVDVQKYQNGAKAMYNTYPLVHGGGRRRQGTKYVAAAKNATKLTRVIPFVFSRTQAFIIELGELYLRFYNPSGQIVDGASVPIEVVSPWDDTELRDLKYVQAADTMFFAHPSYAMRKLVRYSNTSWKLSEVTWEVPPNEEIGERPNATLTLGATSGATTATASAACFREADVGRYIESSAGRASITAFTSTTVVDVTIAAADAFSAVGPIAANAWKITESPKTTCTPSAVGTVGATITLTLALAGWKSLAAQAHVGSFVEINDGLVEITGFTSTTVVDAKVHTVLASATVAQSGAWALRQVAWNSVDGYPRSVGLFQQRLIAGGSTNFPNYVWGTRTGEYYNFAQGVNDADAFTFPLASDQLDAVEHITATKRLFPLTQGAEWSLSGGVEKPLAPTNVKADSETPYGASNVRPVRVGNEIVYIDVSGKVVRAMGYRVENDGYNSPDISVLSEHITSDEDDDEPEGILDMAYQQRPDKLVWMVRDDGLLVSMSIDRDQDAIGFARHETDGEFESVAVIPNSTGKVDQLWAVVVRTIGGAEKRYIERFEEGLNTDSCVTGTTGVATKNWSGLTHLEGKTVDIVADGYVARTKVVSGGAIVLDKAALEVEIGLHYDSYIDTLPPEVSTGQGTAQGNASSIHEIVVRFYKTKGGKAGSTDNPQPLPSRKMGTGTILDQAVPSFTGDKRIEKLGWGKTGGGDDDGSIRILQDQPLPMQVLGVIYRGTFNDG